MWIWKTLIKGGFKNIYLHHILRKKRSLNVNKRGLQLQKLKKKSESGCITRGMLSLRKPVPAILAFISHFHLKQLNLRNDQVHVDSPAAVL